MTLTCGTNNCARTNIALGNEDAQDCREQFWSRAAGTHKGGASNILAKLKSLREFL